MGTDVGSTSYSETDNSNNNPAPAGWPAGMTGNQVEPTGRAMMGALKRLYGKNNPVYTTGGTSTAYTLTSAGTAETAYYTGQVYWFVANATCGTSPSLNIDGLGAANLRKFTAGTYGNCAANDILANQTIGARYNGTQFDIVFQSFSYTDFITASGGATTQAQASNDTKVATDAYVDRVAIQQRLSTITGASATGTTAVPFDDTIPQNTEGDQYMSLSITPKSATSTLKITVVGNFCANNLGSLTMALFQDSTANALAAVNGKVSDTVTTNTTNLTLVYEMTSGTTSSTTFKVRAGTNGGDTVTFNGTGGSRKLGGVMASSITIEEIGI